MHRVAVLWAMPAASALAPSAGGRPRPRHIPYCEKLVGREMSGTCTESGALPTSQRPILSVTTQRCGDGVPIRVSVIVPAYNNVGELAQCLSALRAAADADTELIVIDDASTDDV